MSELVINTNKYVMDIKQQEEIRRRQKLKQQQRQNVIKAQQEQRKQKQIKAQQSRANVKNSATKIDITPWKHFTEAYIVGGGPSLEHFRWELLGPDKFVIGINTSYKVLPHAQITYFTDDDWYELHKKNGFLNHKSVKIKGSLNPNKLQNDSHIYQYLLKGDNGLSTTPGVLHHGSNSPYAAVGMIIQWGFAKTIYLLGIDMQHGRKNPSAKNKKQSHWHTGMRDIPQHRRIDSEGAFKGFIKKWGTIVPQLKEMGVEVINVNNSTALKAFPIKTYEEVFGPNCFKT